MSIALRSTSEGYADFTGTEPLAAPVGTVAGDFLLLALTRNAAAGGAPAVPAGWTLIRTDGHASNGGAYTTLCRRVATGADGITLTAETAGVMLAYTGVDTAAPIDASAVGTLTSSTAPTAPPVTTTDTNHLAVAIFSLHVSGAALTWAGLGTERVYIAESGTALLVGDHTQAAAGATPTQAATGPFGAATAQTVALVRINVAPNAPALVRPVGATTVDSTAAQRLDWTFSDPDSGDTQSKYDLRYRIVGAGAWTTLTKTTTATHRDFTSGALADGNYEWQVRTYDAEGLVGPYSASGFFTVATPPSGPTITAPTDGGTVNAATATVSWSTPDQDAYQVRTVADDGAGNPVTGTVYTDTGTVTSSNRSAVVAFATNNRTEHVQVRIQDAGLWSDWMSVEVDVTYTVPPVPTLTLATDDAAGSIGVSVSNPGRNLLTADEASFEDALAPIPWTALGASSLSRLNLGGFTVEGYDGSRALRITTAGGTEGAYVGGNTTGRQILCAAGDAVTFGAYVKQISGSTIVGRLRLQFFNAANVSVGTTNGPYFTFPGISGEDRQTLTATAPVGTHHVRAFVRVEDDPADSTAAHTSGAVADVDRASLRLNNNSASWSPGGEPDVLSNDIYRRETGDTGDGIRVAVNAGLAWIDYSPASGVDYEYRVVAHGDNDTSSSSEWTGAAVAAPGDSYGTGGY